MRLADLREMGWDVDSTVECVSCGQEVHRLFAVEGVSGDWACPPCALWHRD